MGVDVLDGILFRSGSLLEDLEAQFKREVGFPKLMSQLLPASRPCLAVKGQPSQHFHKSGRHFQLFHYAP